jgi:sugar phosphate isomerase/epimerase
MKFAFSTIACPKWDFDTIAARAKEYGYDGVEVRGFLNEPVLTTANLFLIDAGKLKTTFSDQGLQICCLASPIAMTGDRKLDSMKADDCRRFIDTAAAVGCPLVKVFDTHVKPGQNRGAVSTALANWLSPLGDYAAERNVGIVVENSLSFRKASEMWLMLEQLNHPAITCCWDVANAALVGESPWISVPVLNSRIGYVQVKDAKLSPASASLCKLGEGDVAVKMLLIRLMGVGYGGWVTLEWDKARLAGLGEPEEILPDSIKKLREWSKPPEKPKPAAKPAAAAAAKKVPAAAAAPAVAAVVPKP